MLCSCAQRMAEMDDLRTQMNSMEERHSVLEQKVPVVDCCTVLSFLAYFHLLLFLDKQMKWRGSTLWKCRVIPVAPVKILSV